MKASRAGGGAEAPIGQQAEFANPAAGRPRPAPPDPKAVEAFGAAVAAQARSAVRGGIPSGEVLAAVHRAVAALCAPPPRAWHHEDGVEFTRRFAEMFADPARARSSALWRLAKDPYSTPASVYRLHVSLCAAAALLETYNQA